MKIMRRLIGYIVPFVIVFGAAACNGATSDGGQLPSSKAMGDVSRVLPDKLCARAYEILPQCADLGDTCPSRYASAYLPGAPRNAIAAMQKKQGFNVTAFDKHCQDVCSNPQLSVDYTTFKGDVCRSKD
jgi:hypothetical protein